MDKAKMNLKGKDALNECIRLWQINSTFKRWTSETEHLKTDLADIRAHMQGQHKGTNMFWWRGRYRPKNKDSFGKTKMRKIAEELALAKMGCDGGRMWFTDDKCHDMTLAEMRRHGLKALAMELPKKDLGSNDFFFRGPFWDLHYWDESSRKRFIKTVHEMYNESPIAIDPRYQAGVDHFRKRNFRQLYLGAPDGAKRYYEAVYYQSSPNCHHTKESDKCGEDMIAIYKGLADEDWNYIIKHTHWGMAKWGLSNARRKYGVQGSVT